MEPPNKFISDGTHVVLELNNLQINSYILSKNKNYFFDRPLKLSKKDFLISQCF